MVRVEEQELRREDEVLEDRFPEESEIRLPGRPQAVAPGVPGRVEGVDDQVRS